MYKLMFICTIAYYTNIFMRWKMKCSIQQGKVELNGTVHLSLNQNICSIAWIEKTFINCCMQLVQRFKFLNKLKEKALKNEFNSSKTFYKPHVQLYA